MNDNEIIQGSENWKSIRRDKLGASDASAVLGISKYTTPYQLWEYKTGLAEQSFNGAMHRGHLLEEEAREKFQLEQGVLFKPAVFFHPNIEFMMCSLDGLSSCGMFSVEIKCLKREDHEAAKKGKIHEMYIAQMMHQMAVTGHKQMFYFSYYPYEPSYTIIVKRDDEYIEKMIEKEKEFYRCMTEFDPPPLCDRDYKDMDADKEFELASLVYLTAVMDRKEYEKNEDWAKEQMIAKAQGNAKNRYVKITKYHRKGAVQYDKIEALKGIDLELYRKPAVESYRITEVKDGDTIKTFS